MNDNKSIPKVIHYCWFGKNPLPKDVKKCIKSWKKYCPEYEIKEWNENNFDINFNEFVKKAYEQRCWAFVSDYARLKILYDNGGIYLDTDVELIKNMDFLLKNKCYFGQQQKGRKVATGLGFASVKGHKILRELMYDYETRTFDIVNKDELACPNLNTKVLEKHGYKYSAGVTILDDNETIIYPVEYFDPLSPGTSNTYLSDKTVSIHHYSATWTSQKNQLKRKIFNLIGLERINRLKRIIKK